MTTKLPWTMSGTLVDTRPVDPAFVTFRTDKTAPAQKLFRKCCSCMHVCGAGDEIEIPVGQRIAFVCGCGSHPSVMVCDGKVVGTSA